MSSESICTQNWKSLLLLIVIKRRMAKERKRTWNYLNITFTELKLRLQAFDSTYIEYASRKRAINSIYSATNIAASWCWKSNKLLFPYVCRCFISLTLRFMVVVCSWLVESIVFVRKMYYKLNKSFNICHSIWFRIKFVRFPDKSRVVLYASQYTIVERYVCLLLFGNWLFAATISMAYHETYWKIEHMFGLSEVLSIITLCKCCRNL